MDGWNENEKTTNHVEATKYVAGLTFEEAEYVRRDCLAAMAAMPNGHKAGHYADIAAYCGMKLNRNPIIVKLEDRM